MPEKIKAKSFQIVIRLGDTPEFRITADEDETATPSSMTRRRKGIKRENIDVLREFVAAVMAAYPDNKFVSLCVDGAKILPQSDCNS